MSQRTLTKTESRPLAGLMLMLGASAAFVVMAAFVKVGREHGMTTAETIVWRMAPGLPWLGAELWLRGEPIFRPRRPFLVTLRSAFGGAAMVGSFYAVSALTLLQHTVLHLAQPVFVAALAPLLLQERLRGAAVAALMLALGGAVAVIRPDRIADGIGDVPLLAGGICLAAALFSAFAHMTVRLSTGRLSSRDHAAWLRRLTGDRKPEAPETVVFHFTLHLSLLAFVFGLLRGDFHHLPHGLTLEQTGLTIVGMAVFGALGQLLMSRAYARAEAPVVAIAGYAAIPLSVLFDTIGWGTPLAFSSLLGAGLMITAGVLLARR